MILWLSGLTLSAEALLGLALLISIKKPKHRIWPPPKKQSWQFWLVWTAVVSMYLGLTTLAVLDWNNSIFPDWLRYFVGLPLLLGGLVLAFWGSGILGWKRTSGQKGDLQTDGLYRYSRNPQYLGDSINLIGLALFVNSSYALLPALFGAALYIFWPLTEEPWLRERFGAAYEHYYQRVPRFFSFKGVL